MGIGASVPWRDSGTIYEVGSPNIVSCTRLDAQASGGAVLELASLSVTDATIDFSGGVKATLTVSGALRGTATGGVVVDLAASPASVDVDTSGGAVVKHS